MAPKMTGFLGSALFFVFMTCCNNYGGTVSIEKFATDSSEDGETGSEIDSENDSSGNGDLDSDVMDSESEIDTDSGTTGGADTGGDGADSETGYADRCNDEAGVDLAASDSYGPGAVRALHKPITCGEGSDVEQDNGPPQNRINLILIGDGYTQEELQTTWAEHVDNALDVMFGPNTEPYGTYQSHINICRLNVASPESGVDLATGSWPPSDYTYLEYKDTAFDGVCNEQNRLGTTDDQKVRQKIEELLGSTGVDADWIGAVLNTDRWCNAGGAIANWAGYTNPLDVAFHESGHSWHGLADEYGGNCVYDGKEPAAVNVTKLNGSKWTDWAEFDQPDIGIISWYEGGHYCDRGIYRPSQDSKMNWTGNPHNVVGRQKIVRDIYALVRPIDAWTDNRKPLVNPCRIEIKLVDDTLVKVIWQLDGETVSTDDKGTLWIGRHDLSPGTHEIVVIAKDETTYVRGSRTGLSQTLSWTVEIAEP